MKEIVKRALDSEENYNLLFVGPPASLKTLFLQGILECRKGVFLDGSNTTNRILDVLEQERPKIICIDEIDKASRQLQNQILNLESKSTNKRGVTISTVVRQRVKICSERAATTRNPTIVGYLCCLPGQTCNTSDPAYPKCRTPGQPC